MMSSGRRRLMNAWMTNRASAQVAPDKNRLLKLRGRVDESGTICQTSLEKIFQEYGNSRGMQRGMQKEIAEYGNSQLA